MTVMQQLLGATNATEFFLWAHDSWGHAFLPVYGTCLFTVSLPYLGLLQFLHLPLQLALPACLIHVCVWGPPPEGSLVVPGKDESLL